MGYIYMIENKINHKKYVGQTKKHKLNRRVSKTLHSHTRDNKKLSIDVESYGIDNFIVKIILQCDNYKLDLYEKWFILLYNTIEYGYNKDIGGLKGKHNYGKKCPRCGKLFRGKNKYCCKAPKERITKVCVYCGKSYETYPSKVITSKYCSLQCKNKHQKITFLHNTNSNGKNAGKYNGRAKRCICIETGVIFDTARDASTYLGCKGNDVASVCSGRQKTVKGYTFRWC